MKQTHWHCLPRRLCPYGLQQKRHRHPRRNRLYQQRQHYLRNPNPRWQNPRRQRRHMEKRGRYGCHALINTPAAVAMMLAPDTTRVASTTPGLLWWWWQPWQPWHDCRGACSTWADEGVQGTLLTVATSLTSPGIASLKPTPTYISPACSGDFNGSTVQTQPILIGTRDSSTQSHDRIHRFITICISGQHRRQQQKRFLMLHHKQTTHNDNQFSKRKTRNPFWIKAVKLKNWWRRQQIDGVAVITS